MDSTEESLHLPDEIIGEVLVRLRVKSLLRLRCVSKSWLSLINSEEFIKSHRQYSAKNPDSAHHKVLIFTERDGCKQCSLRSLSGDPVGTRLSRIPRMPSPGYFSAASCCNGLVCVYNYGRFHLHNPSTRVSKELPEDPEIDNREYGFGLKTIVLSWDESSGAYKVFAYWDKSRGNVIRIYNSKTNSWKGVECPTKFEIGVGVGAVKFVGGKVHWLGNKTIISFDMKSEVFETIELPCEVGSWSIWWRTDLGDVGGCLCLIDLNHYEPTKPIDFWVMKEYGVRESWEKRVTIHLDPEFHLGWSSDDNNGRPTLIGEAANGEILVAYRRRLLVYCPKNGVFRCRRKIGSYLRAHLYVESLVSPVREITSLNI